jgi:hypothetical protein
MDATVQAVRQRLDKVGDLLDTWSLLWFDMSYSML